MNLDDTIAAIATPVGEGGLAVIRLSGPAAVLIADRCFRPAGKAARRLPEVPSHTISFGHIVRNGQVIDEVLCSVMRAPRSFTAEDVVEISCHGGVLAAKLVLDTVLAAGARLAEPGEFSKRAFLNGRIDLAQAEAINDVIHAKTELALAAANQQLAGRLSQRVMLLRDQMMNCLAHIEAHIDFPEEDIGPDTSQRLQARLREGLALMDQLLATANEGRILRTGIRVGIIGRPNAGKSSLLNALVGHDRAIVSSIPGTTRDTVEETANIRGLPVVFIDTAGLREARDEIELEGIRRSRKTLENAELILHVLDGTRPYDPHEFLQSGSRSKRIIIKNKVDLDNCIELPPDIAGVAVAVSCVTGEGIEALKDRIRDAVWSGDARAEMLEAMVNSRHQEALSRARAATHQSLVALQQGQTLELVAMDLHVAVNAIGEIVGKTATEDLLDRIFSQFCIGK